MKALSKYKLIEAEKEVFAKGLNFLIAPECVPVTEIITVTEVTCQQLKLENGQPDEEIASLLRKKVVGILENAKTPLHTTWPDTLQTF